MELVGLGLVIFVAVFFAVACGKLLWAHLPSRITRESRVVFVRVKKDDDHEPTARH